VTQTPNLGEFSYLDADDGVSAVRSFEVAVLVEENVVTRVRRLDAGRVTAPVPSLSQRHTRQ